MKSLFKIYRRYIFSAAWIAGTVILVNLLALFGVSAYFHSQSRNSPARGTRLRVTQAAQMLEQNPDGTVRMSEEGTACLDSSGAEFAFLLNDAGDVIWDWRLPDEIPTHFSLGEVASFSRWYLKDYPVRVWNCDAGLLVIGEPKFTAAKYSVEFSRDSIRNVPYFLLALVGANILLVLILAVLSGYRLYASLRPVASGIDGLSSGRKVLVPEHGLVGDLGRKLNQAARMLEQQRWNLEKRDTARTEWISGVSHDIRTPLSMVMGYADNLENDAELPEEARKQAGIIKEQSLKIKTLIEDLNLTSKLEYQMQPLRMEKYVPAALLRSVAVSCLNGGLEEGYELEVDIGEELEGLVLAGDVRLMTRALHNLIGNSIRHNTGCRILLSGRLVQQGPVPLCRIGVKDDGNGIPQEIRDILEEKPAMGGPGAAEGGKSLAGQPGNPKGQSGNPSGRPHIMGLRIVKQIINAHGGRMEFSGDGREVILLLPVTGTLDTEKKKEKKKWWEILWYGENRIKTLEKN
ncbi:HAMP domain-containing sensor histidine kinase [Eisenbergiella porci]|uniref:HAMP domain-containing sensor histidine kinase n=1 Tax=Eisenbergiella porci TaxID=2652274 RepID=UPI002A80533D|nr:HAMP domain-containing sensor histidine kinase [Eisenbergiella porci]